MVFVISEVQTGTWGRSVNIQIQTVLRLILQPPYTPPDRGQAAGRQPGERGRPVGQLGQLLGTHGGELVRQQGLLPRGDSHGGHEPQVTKWGGGKWDAQECCHGLEVVSWLVGHSLDGPVLGLDVTECRLPSGHQDRHQEGQLEHPRHQVRSFSFNQTNDNLSGLRSAGLDILTQQSKTS